MLAITGANSANLMSSTKSTTQKKPFKFQREAIGAAILELGPESRHRFEFETEKVDGVWIWRATDPEAALAKAAANGAQLKANGGRKSVLAMAVAIEAKGGKVPDAVLNDAAAAALHIEKAKVDATDGIPAFLKREPDTAEQKEARIEKHKKTSGPGRVIKNPPNVKDATAKASKGKRAGGKGQTKTALVGQLLLRKEGCTTADILAATGWPAVSVPAQAKAVGLGLRKEKDGKVTRYFGVPQK